MSTQTKHNQSTDELRFAGFEEPTANYFKMPNSWTDITARIENMSELKVVEYILRHTWGWNEYGVKKKITVDEFMHGRKGRNGLRMDAGTGLSESSVKRGLAAALAHGLIEEEVDDRDKARTKKYYCLRMRNEQDAQELPEDPADEADRARDDLEHNTAKNGEGTPSFRGFNLNPQASGQTETDSKPDSGGSKRTPEGFNLNPRSEKDTSEKHFYSDSPNREEKSEQTGKQKKKQQSTLNSTPNRGGGFKPIGEVAELMQQHLLMRASEAPSPDPNNVFKRPRRGLGSTKRRQLSNSSSLSKTHAQGPFQAATATARIADTIKMISLQFGDAKVNANISHAGHLFADSGLSEQAFLDWLYLARSETQQSAGVRNRMAYFFAILHARLGKKT